MGTAACPRRPRPRRRPSTPRPSRRRRPARLRELAAPPRAREGAGRVELRGVRRLVVDLRDVGDRRQVADRRASLRGADHVVEAPDVAEHRLDFGRVMPGGRAACRGCAGRWPAAARRSTTCEPMKPEPPVTSTVLMPRSRPVIERDAPVVLRHPVGVRQIVVRAHDAVAWLGIDLAGRALDRAEHDVLVEPRDHAVGQLRPMRVQRIEVLASDGRSSTRRSPPGVRSGRAPIAAVNSLIRKFRPATAWSGLP